MISQTDQFNSNISCKEIYSLGAITFSGFRDTPKIQKASINFTALKYLFKDTIQEFNIAIDTLLQNEQSISKENINRDLNSKLMELAEQKIKVNDTVNLIKKDLKNRVKSSKNVENYNDLQIEFLNIPNSGSFSIRIKNGDKYLKLTYKDGKIEAQNKDGKDASIFELLTVDDTKGKNYVIIHNP